MSNEMFYRDKDGKKQDAALHADILEADNDIRFSFGMDAKLLQGRIKRDDWHDTTFRSHWNRYEEKRKTLNEKDLLVFPEGVTYPPE